MVDRQELDALLIGALYGELSPADEARLAAHLESHPADRSALEGLKTAREAVHESRVFADQAEPPQSLSALLLQEAHRRAPRAKSEPPTEGWLARFLRLFVAHPAMAAAATLVLVVGVAGTMYLRQGKLETAEVSHEVAVAAQAPASTATTPVAAAPTGTPAPSVGDSPGMAAGSAGDVAQVDLAQPRQKAPAAEPAVLSGEQRSEDKPQNYHRAQNAIAFDGMTKEKALAPPPAHASSPARAAGKKATGYLEVQKHDLAPKDLDEGQLAQRDRTVANGPTTRGAANAPSGATSSTIVTAAPMAANAAASPPPPPPQAAPAPKLAKTKPEPPAKPTAEDPALRKQLDQAVKLAQDNKCTESAKVAERIRASSPAFYDQNVAENRELIKPCGAYINAARDSSNELASKRAAKARASSADDTGGAPPAASAPAQATPAPSKK
jgi:hypothetical protein